MCIGLASRNQHEVQAVKMADIWPLKTCWDTLMEKCESETKELLRQYNKEECSQIDERQDYVQEVESIPTKETSGKREFYVIYFPCDWSAVMFFNLTLILI